MKLLDQVRERWTTWRTGKTREEREWEAWVKANINWRSDRVRDIFGTFRYVIDVDPDKFLVDHALTWVPHPDARQYFYPVRPLGRNAVWKIMRVHQQTGIGLDGETQAEWFVNELGGEDRLFVATNSEQDAVIISLRWS